MTFTASAEQQAIIDHPGRSLRISAGAGTGKTTTIVRRLAAAVASGTDPARALGITFTNKAADELRERLRSAIDIRDDGRDVEVATYHGFAASILDEFGSRHGWPPRAVIMDEGHRFELAERVLRKSTDTHLDLTKIPSLRKDVLAMADALNDHLIDGEDVRRLAPDPPDEVWLTRLSLIEAAERYRIHKSELGLVEYSDLIRHATRIVESDRAIADEVGRRYDIVLLDEYQDTDRAQRRMLTAAFHHCPSVTAVGDADQTIYEWRGASIRNFESFPEDFPALDGTPAPTLPLSINRRSDRRIIDLANRVRGRLPTIDGSRDLRTADDADAGSVVASWHRSDADEAAWIAGEIARRHDEGVPFADMAVMCRRRDSLRTFAETFRRFEIPFTVSSMSDLLDVPEVADLHAWLTILARPDDDHALLRVLMGGRYRLGLGDVAAIRRSPGATAGAGLLDGVLDPDPPPGMDESAIEAMAGFADTYRELYADAQAASVSATVATTVDALDFWGEVAAMPQASAITARLNLGRFIDLADRWHPLAGYGDLRSFLRYLDALAEPGRAEELDAAEPPAEDAVVLTTAHGAKGLEWGDVYLADVANGVFPSRVRDYFEPLSKGAAIPYEARLDADDFADVSALDDSANRKALLKLRHEDQEWRLAYVAVTRAKHRLSVSGHRWHADNTTPRVPGELLDAVLGSDGVDLGPIAPDDVPRPEPEPYRPAGTPPDPLFPDGWTAAIRTAIDDPDWLDQLAPDMRGTVASERAQLELRLDGLTDVSASAAEAPFATSVTNLVALAECPLKFRWIHHDRLPRRPRASARRGTDFHRRAELHNLGVVSLTDAADARYDAPGEDGDGAEPGVDPWPVFMSSRFSSDRPRFVETPFVITIGGRSVRGKIDAVYADDGRWEIVDYKSGSAAPSDTKRIQLEAYALAADDGALGARAPDELEVTFAWFGDDPAVEITESVDTEWLDRARHRVGDLLALAESGPFEASPSPACRWCDFLHHCSDGQSYLAPDG